MGNARRRLAIVFCVHHKPWLMMATLLTLVSQDDQDADLFFVYNVGDGGNAAGNAQLSPFDERVRAVCRVARDRVFEIEYRNDAALDSGTWHKFIRDGRWREYEHVLFLGEGTLLAHPRLIHSLLAFAARRSVHFIASGHEKRRIPRDVFLRHPDQGGPIADVFAVFRRDPEFAAGFDRWRSDFAIETEHHVPGVDDAGGPWRRVRSRLQQHRVGGRLPHAIDYWNSRLRLRMPEHQIDGGGALAYRGGSYDTRSAAAADVDCELGVTFHRVSGPEWFGCATNHLMSREFLERLSAKLDRFRLYDALELPFAGSALEIVWGLMPAWLGVEKWFSNGFHRVRKNFATYQREDEPAEMASYVNRYHRGRLAVGWRGDYLQLEAWRPGLGDLRRILPGVYFPEGARP